MKGKREGEEEREVEGGANNTSTTNSSGRLTNNLAVLYPPR